MSGGWGADFGSLRNNGTLNLAGIGLIFPQDQRGIDMTIILAAGLTLALGLAATKKPAAVKAAEGARKKG